MFEVDTVLVLGAGASWHYGYPTGEELVAAVKTHAQQLRSFFDRQGTSSNFPKIIQPTQPINSTMVDLFRKHWQLGMEQCETLRVRLEDSDPLVIDYFLGLNPDIEDIGRFLIAWEILRCENREPDPERKKWVRFITSQLVTGCRKATDLHSNKLTVITFNYDTSFEQSIYRGLAGHSLLREEVS